MWVDVLQTARKLVVEAVDERDDTAPDANDTLRFSLWQSLDRLVVLLSYHFLNGVFGFFDKDQDQLVELFLGRRPYVDWHVCRRGIVVEASGQESQENAYLLIGCDCDGEQLFQHLDLFHTIGVLRELHRVIQESEAGTDIPFYHDSH